MTIFFDARLDELEFSDDDLTSSSGIPTSMVQGGSPEFLEFSSDYSTTTACSLRIKISNY